MLENIELNGASSDLKINHSKFINNKSKLDENIENNEPPIDYNSKASGLKNTFLEHFYKLICGFDRHESEVSQAKSEKQKIVEAGRRLESFYSLNQSKKDRIILNINLILIILIAIGFFIFFSISPEEHIFSNINLNITQSS
jgi:NADH:ubiquinone oxidoreductase subunit C